ncbi:MAG: PAC2 family protein [Chloroflexi bacterium]|nr:PAC2 family protein [Chloroflexota bacterium]
MQIGAFEIHEPIPEFKNLHAIALLHPWVDAGNVGTLSLERLESHFGAKELGKLHRPGNFFDFTRYRPTSQFVEGQRVIVVPNTNIYYALGTDGPDFLFIHLMEPHAFAERYVKSVVDLLKTLNVKRYCRISGMYNAVPHTRPLRVTGSPELEKMPGMSGLITPRQSTGGYQGPTSIMNSLAEELEKSGTEMINFMVHLPHYLSLEDDYAGTARLMEVLCTLYDLPPHLMEADRGATQYQEVGTQLQHNTQVKALISQLEEYYDDQQSPEPEEETPPLAPDVETFLREIGLRLDDK